MCYVEMSVIQAICVDMCYRHELLSHSQLFGSRDVSVYLRLVMHENLPLAVGSFSCVLAQLHACLLHARC